MTGRKIIVLVLSLLFATITSSKVWACTGRPYAAEMEDFDEFDLWVRATVIDRDDRGFNAIVRTEEYYKGEGPRLLVVKRHPTALGSVTALRGYSNGCLGNGGGQRFRKGSSGYFGLRPNGDGTYTDWYSGSAHFYARDGVIQYYQDFDWHEMSENNFVAKLLSIGGRDKHVAPQFEAVQRYPLMRYLMITTEKGTRYQVNPDRSVTPVPANSPLAMSPDTAHWAYRLDDDTLGFGRPYQRQGNPAVSYFHEITGRDLRFSEDSNMVAVWDDSVLSIYLFGIAGFNYQGGAMSMERIAMVDLDTSGGSAPRVMWSADSTTLAWQDASGIWRWNLYEDEQPRLQVAEHDCYLIDISSGGRYVRYGTARGWTLHDSSTGKRYSNAIAAPGEKVLIFINGDDAPVPSWRGDHVCVPPLTQNCAPYISTEVRPVEITIYPSKNGRFGLQFCEYDGLCDEIRYSWNPSALWNWYNWTWTDMDQDPWRQYAYDPFYDRKAILYGEYQINLQTRIDMIFRDSDDIVYGHILDSVELEGIVDSPIASIEWGQPIFYDSFMLTATEYLPRTVTAYDVGSARRNGSSEA